MLVETPPVFHDIDNSLKNIIHALYGTETTPRQGYTLFVIWYSYSRDRLTSTHSIPHLWPYPEGVSADYFLTYSSQSE
jgi:hypothetical protein